MSRKDKNKLSLTAKGEKDIQKIQKVQAVQEPKKANEPEVISLNSATGSIRAAIKEEYYSGPLPPPKTLEYYNSILPGAADRIMIMAEKEQLHRHCLQEKMVSSDCKNSTLGIWSGFGIGICGLAATVLITYLGHATEGAIVGSISIGGLIKVFIENTKIHKDNKDSKGSKGNEGADKD